MYGGHDDEVDLPPQVHQVLLSEIQDLLLDRRYKYCPDMSQCRYIIGILWIFVDICGILCIFVDIIGIFVDICGNLWIFVDGIL